MRTLQLLVQPIRSRESADWPHAGNTNRHIRDSRKQKKKILPNTDIGDSSSELSSVEATQRKKISKPKAASTPKKRAQDSRLHDEVLHEYDSISESSETEHQKLCKEFEKVFQIALRGRESDPLSGFIVGTVPRIFEFLSFREAAPLNASGNQAREETFTKEINQLYDDTKAAIIRESDHNKSQSQTNENLSQTIQNNSILHQPDMQVIGQIEPALPHSTDNITSPSEIITRSKSVKNTEEQF